MRRCGTTAPPSSAVRAQHQRIAVEPLEGTAVDRRALCTIEVQGGKALESPIACMDACMDVCMYACRVCMRARYAYVYKSPIACMDGAGYTACKG